MKIALLFDGASALGKSPDLLILETVEAVEAVLAAEGNQVVRVPVHTDGRWVERVRRTKADVVFNLCEGIDGIAALEPTVISALEVLGIPFTGSPSWTTSLCLRKHVVNAILDRSRLPIPRFAVVRPGEPIPTVGFPAICKPAAEDASLGVEQRSVVRTMRALAERVASMHEHWDEVLVQRYIDGREVNVGILGDQVLPVSEIQFDAMPKGMWRIVSYRSKWATGSDEDTGAQPQCPAHLPPELAEQLQRLAMQAWRVVGGEGYGRVDFRIDRAGRPWILEVNSNPDIAPDAGLARMAGVEGLDYGALVRTICERALHRERVLTADRWALVQRLSGVAVGDDGSALELFAVGER
jgi:D-alanine-D-alanine ligase